ncbi:DNA repair RAD50 [Micractinium conductrix]|uniref:DNA repair protein RAD50 n=1 Tax=Micractinium conductrix TaxID=554055 RepID=A0A2P6V370_9CHLO|nr:DNA repair RAD50 [Micractinium conductrix]|eukprot:PSC68536.1 DNA repair RAD50 [Micractinium conductrix]
MLIKGIRSFSPDNQNVIEFYRPLTLIVGHNGAGKTTVIECLKMACTGELPPNTRSGQSFIHDPKVARETEVKAQIKLRFVTSARQPVVVIRSFQLTQKKSTMQFKALDNVLQTISRDTGQKEALSYRCADIDRIVPQLMGVSKAVLENVIFVHQEESNWPLDEGQVLKKKFDDIFAATKYTKALEVLRKLYTEKASEVKLMKANLEVTKTKKDQAQRLRQEVEGGTARAAQLEQKIAEQDGEIQDTEARIQELAGRLGQIQDIGEELTRLRTEYELQVRSNAEAYNKLISNYSEEDAAMSLEELEALRHDIDPQLNDTAQEERRLQREEHVARMEVETAKEQYERDIKQQGRLAAEAEAHARNQADLQRFLATICSEAGVTVPDGSPAAAVTAFSERLETASAELGSAKAANRRIDDSMGKQIDNIAAGLSGRAEAQRMKRDEASRNDRRVAELQAQLGNLIVSPDMLAGARQQEQQWERQLRDKQAELTGSTCEQETQQLTDRLAELARRASELRKERDQLAASAEGATRVRLKTQELQGKQVQLDCLRGSARTRLNGLLGASVGAELPPTEQLAARMAEALQQRSSDVEGIRRQVAELTAKVNGAQGSLAVTRRQLEAAEQEAAALDRQLQSGLQVAADGGAAPAAPATPLRVVEEQTHAVEQEKKAKSDRLAGIEYYQMIGRQMIVKAEQSNLCFTCSRPFASTAERQQFLHQRNAELNNAPSMKAQVEQEVEAANWRLATLRALQPAALRFDSLFTKEIPELRERVRKLEEEVTDHTETKAELEETQSSAQGELQAAQEAQEMVRSMLSLAQDISERAAEVQRLQGETAATAATRSVTNVDKDLEEVDREKAEAENKRADCQRRQNRLRDELAHMRSEHQKAREESLHLQAASEKRAAIERQIADLLRLNEALQQEIDAAQRERQPKEQERDALQRERDAKRAAAAQHEGELETRLRQLHTWDSQMTAKQRAIEEYTNLGKADALQRVNAALDSLRQRQLAGEERVKALSQELRDLQARKAEENETKRQIDDTMAYHQGKAKEVELGGRLDKIGADQGNMGDKGAIERECGQLEARLQKLRSARDMDRGALGTMHERIKVCTEELDVAQYHDIETKYRQQNIEVKTTEMAQGDLQKYHKALEKALLSFHTSKMADINTIVKELWQKTYRNSDIDYIQIKADAEGAAGRSYNYRVVMHCGEAELDMRGRCSAGQKVLACLIIRLALAETFCLNCGILALDEPTTNLDAENSASLAEALRAIMHNRRDQENFQLVVITHDEMFARLIGTREHAEFMWRITKDEAQHSTVTQEDIME